MASRPVALRKESVDRNLMRLNPTIVNTASLSARRAWIEISALGGTTISEVVALRKESVDRNIPEEVENHEEQTSLSARRAWIEISNPPIRSCTAFVALRKESVDRNKIKKRPPSNLRSRSPQGERG